MFKLIPVLLFTWSFLAAKSIDFYEKFSITADTNKVGFLFPKNIADKFKAKPSESETNGIGQALDFRPIESSLDGNLAYLKIGCNGACGCCSQVIYIQNLTTNKIIDTLVVLNSDEVNENLAEKVNHYWDKNIKKINLFLNKYKIKQQNISLLADKNIKIQNDVFTTALDFKVEEVTEGGDWVQNSVRYKINISKNGKTAKSIENQEAGYQMKYVGSYQSLNTKHLVFIFNVHAKGFESELTENIVIIGFQL